MFDLSEFLAREGASFDDRLGPQLPDEGGVYRVYSSTDRSDTLYIGEASNLRRRLHQKLWRGNTPVHALRKRLLDLGICHNEHDIHAYLQQNCRVQYAVLEDGHARRLVEGILITLLMPVFNKQR